MISNSPPSTAIAIVSTSTSASNNQERINQGMQTTRVFLFFLKKKIVDGCIFSSALSSFLHQKSLKFIFLVHEEEEEQERMFVVSFQRLYPLLGYNYCVFQRD